MIGPRALLSSALTAALLSGCGVTSWVAGGSDEELAGVYDPSMPIPLPRGQTDPILLPPPPGSGVEDETEATDVAEADTGVEVDPETGELLPPSDADTDIDVAAEAPLPVPEPAAGTNAVVAESVQAASPADNLPVPQVGGAAPQARRDGLVLPSQVPHIYMALQPDSSGTTSVIFAIDESRDGTPTNDPAIRITPEPESGGNGQCNPQPMRNFDFPPQYATRPAYGPPEAARGIGARDLPKFLAVEVSSAMIASGLADEPQQTRPQNVCTRLLWERQVVESSTRQG